LAEVIFINRYFPPDHSATSQMVGDLAFHLARRGVRVGVITSRQRYDDASARLPPREELQGVSVRRVWTSRFGRAFLPGRAVDYATFYLSALVAMLRLARRGTTLVALTDPPMISVVAALAAALRGATLVNWTQDLFPEVAESLGMRGMRVLRFARDWSLRRARVNVALGARMAERIRATGAPVVVRHNWAGADLHDAGRREGKPFVVAYSGNLGRAHEFETILAAMRELSDDEGVRFLFIGGGAQWERVRRDAGANVEFAPYAPREALSESLSGADAHVVSLLPELEGLIVPSKFYGALAVARPVLFVGARDGELARIIQENDCGVVVERGDATGLAHAVRELARDRGKAEAMGRRGREVYERELAPRVALKHWEEILDVG
jgi:colanic acid biosynthesis glycosyl transferase WcaI